MSETINEKLARLLTENPDLPIRVHVWGERADDMCGGWGNLEQCEVTEYVWYEPDECYYFGRANFALCASVRDAIEREYRREYGKSPQLGDSARLTLEAVSELDWKPCILLWAGPWLDLK